jgi:hypothetical protein
VVPGKRPIGVIGPEKFPPHCQVISDFAGNLLEMRQECDMKVAAPPPAHAGQAEKGLIPQEQLGILPGKGRPS